MVTKSPPKKKALILYRRGLEEIKRETFCFQSYSNYFGGKMIKVSFEYLRIHWLGWVLAVVFLVLRTQEISAQGEEWIARYNGPGYSGDEAYDLAVDDSGNVYVTGMGRGGFGIYSDFITIKYNSMGDTLWVRIYNGLGNEGDVAYSLAVDDSGNVYVTGYS